MELNVNYSPNSIQYLFTITTINQNYYQKAWERECNLELTTDQWSSVQINIYISFNIHSVLQDNDPQIVPYFSLSEATVLEAIW